MKSYDRPLANISKSIFSSLQKKAFFDFFELSGHNATDNLEHDFILERLENPACVAGGFVERRFYNNKIFANESQQNDIINIEQIFTPEPNDFFYETESSTSIVPE